jgi:hypothetical protein
MQFSDLSHRILRERINLSQAWEAWIDAEDMRRHSFLGSMGFEARDGKDYLYRRVGGAGKSLGPRSEQTEEQLARFKDGREENRARLQRLQDSLDKQAAILRGLRDGRLPVVAARILRELRLHSRQSRIRVVGTNALYAYEALAGVRFEVGATATSDTDLLHDDRNRLRLLTDERRLIGLAEMIKSRIDASFTSRNPRDYRLTNAEGYMVELIRPKPRPAWKKMPGAESGQAGDLVGTPIIGLQWLVNAPAVDTIVVDERGYPAPIRCPDPRYWAAHKFWLSTREDRDPAKKGRDAAQALAVVKLIAEKLPHLPLDEVFFTPLPNALRDQIKAIVPAKGDDRPGW